MTVSVIATTVSVIAMTVCVIATTVSACRHSDRSGAQWRNLVLCEA